MFTTTPRGFKSEAETANEDYSWQVSSSPKEPVTRGRGLFAFLCLMQCLNVYGFISSLRNSIWLLSCHKIHRCHLFLFLFTKDFLFLKRLNKRQNLYFSLVWKLWISDPNCKKGTPVPCTPTPSSLMRMEYSVCSHMKLPWIGKAGTHQCSRGCLAGLGEKRAAETHSGDEGERETLQKKLRISKQGRPPGCMKTEAQRRGSHCMTPVMGGKKRVGVLTWAEGFHSQKRKEGYMLALCFEILGPADREADVSPDARKPRGRSQWRQCSKIVSMTTRSWACTWDIPVTEAWLGSPITLLQRNFSEVKWSSELQLLPWWLLCWVTKMRWCFFSTLVLQFGKGQGNGSQLRTALAPTGHSAIPGDIFYCHH